MTLEESKIFSADPELQEKVKQSFIRFLKFLKFKLAQDDDVVRIEPETPNSIPPWLRQFNHTMLRVTRILKCLRLTGNNKYAVAFYDALRPFKAQVSWNTWAFWTGAVFDPLWPEPIEL